MKLRITDLTKQYSKNKFGLTDFSLDIESGILGLLGPNGAGKSTLMKLIATVSKPSSGQILLNDRDIAKEPNYIREQLGFLPQDFGVYPQLNAYEFLAYIAAMKGVGGSGLKQRIASLIEGVNLTEVAKNPIGTYSGGMKQRIGIAQVLLNDPKVMIFDEPMVGLDPEERLRFRNLISELSAERIVILSSHIVSDIETIADAVAVMKNGRLLFSGEQDDVVDMVSGKVFERVIERSELDLYKEKYLVANTSRSKQGIRIRIITTKPESTFEPDEASLEDAYLWLTKGNATI